MDSHPVLIAGGGTGGHIYPGLAVAAELRRRRPSIPIIFVGTRSGLESRLVPAAGYPLRLVRAGGIAGKAWTLRLANALLVPVGMAQSAWLVMKQRARVVVGVGGYASGPTVMAARLLGRRTMILEQNAIPGATNRILAPVVDHVAVAFTGTAGRLPGRVTVTGNPVRAGLTTRQRPVRDDGAFSLLIFGGSRGAHGLNQAVIEALPALAACGQALAIVHQTGAADRDAVAAAYREAGIDAQVVEYIDDMAAAYAAADLVICRAGATSVAELSAVGRAAILVPLPTATGGHQEENAREMATAGAAVLLRQDEAGHGRLAELALGLLRDARGRQDMEEAAVGLGAPRAASRVVDLLLALYDRDLRRAAKGNGSPA